MRRTKDEAARTREAILDAAERLFFDQGVAGTTLSHIACAAGLTRGAIYWHFENKLDLFRAMQQRARLPQEAFFHDAERSRPPSVAELYDNTIEALEFLSRDERTQRVLTILMFRCEYVGEMQPAMHRRDSAETAMRLEIAKIFDHAHSSGAYGARDCEPADIATAYVATISGVMNEWLRSDRAFDLVTVGRRALGTILSGYGCPLSTPLSREEVARPLS